MLPRAAVPHLLHHRQSLAHACANRRAVPACLQQEKDDDYEDDDDDVMQEGDEPVMPMNRGRRDQVRTRRRLAALMEPQTRMADVALTIVLATLACA